MRFMLSPMLSTDFSMSSRFISLTWSSMRTRKDSLSAALRRIISFSASLWLSTICASSASSSAMRASRLSASRLASSRRSTSSVLSCKLSLRDAISAAHSRLVSSTAESCSVGARASAASAASARERCCDASSRAEASCIMSLLMVLAFSRSSAWVLARSCANSAESTAAAAACSITEAVVEDCAAPHTPMTCSGFNGGAGVAAIHAPNTAFSGVPIACTKREPWS